jgi:hypothetical protein
MPNAKIAMDLSDKLRGLTVKDLEELIRKKWCGVSYLIINFKIRDLVESTKVLVPDEALKVLTSHLHAYINEGKMPPAQIKTAVLNVAEDLSAKRPVDFRAGDYIALQEFARAKG